MREGTCLVAVEGVIIQAEVESFIVPFQDLPSKFEGCINATGFQSLHKGHVQLLSCKGRIEPLELDCNVVKSQLSQCWAMVDAIAV